MYNAISVCNVTLPIGYCLGENTSSIGMSSVIFTVTKRNDEKSTHFPDDSRPKREYVLLDHL